MVYVLEFIEKDSKYYVAKYCSYDNTIFGTIIISNPIVKWFKSAPINGKANYDMTIGSNTTKVFVEKVLNDFDKSIYMKLLFNNNTLYIPENKFSNIRCKAFCFQNFVEIKIFDGNGQLTLYKYRFFKNYNIRNQAIYNISKIGYRFAVMYKKHFIQDRIITDSCKVLEPFHENIIYEHEYIFRTKDNGIASYIFSVISIERK